MALLNRCRCESRKRVGSLVTMIQYQLQSEPETIQTEAVRTFSFHPQLFEEFDHVNRVTLFILNSPPFLSAHVPRHFYCRLFWRKRISSTDPRRSCANIHGIHKTVMALNYNKMWSSYFLGWSPSVLKWIRMKVERGFREEPNSFFNWVTAYQILANYGKTVTIYFF